jgi:hypothetical protein
MAKLRELQPEKFEKRRLARDLHATLASRLLRAKSVLPTLTKFIECSDDQPCGLEGCCPMCIRRFRRGLMRETHRLGLDQQTWMSASIFPADWRAAEGDLVSVDLKKFAKQATEWMESYDAGDRLLMGGIDVVNVGNENSTWPDFWQLHLT